MFSNDIVYAHTANFGSLSTIRCNNSEVGYVVVIDCVCGTITHHDLDWFMKKSLLLIKSTYFPYNLVLVGDPIGMSREALAAILRTQIRIFTEDIKDRSSWARA